MQNIILQIYAIPTLPLQPIPHTDTNHTTLIGLNNHICNTIHTIFPNFIIQPKSCNL